MPHVERTGEERAVYNWLTLVLPASYVVTFEDADGPRPDGPYATIKVETMTARGTGDNTVKDQPSGGQYQGLMQLHFAGTASLNLYASDARKQMQRLRASIELPDIYAAMHADGLFVSRMPDAIDLTALEGIGSTPRFQADAFFNWSTVTGYDGEVIETVAATQV